MKKRVLSVALTLALLLGMIAAVSIVPIAATVTGATLSALDAAPTDTSLIAGKTPLTEQLTAAVPLESNYRNGKAAAMTDGVYPGVNKDIEPKRDPQGNLLNQDDAHPNWGIQNTTNDTIGTVRAVEEYTDLAYDLGASGNITGFVIGSTAEPKSLKKATADTMTQQEILDWYKANLQKHLRLRKGAFYVSNDKTTLFTGTPVATWDLTADETPIGAKYVLDAAVQGQYVGFRLYDFDSESWSNQVRIGELAVHGAAVASSPVVGATLSELTAAPTDTSLIAGKTPLTEQLTASVPLESNYRNGKAAAMTDGVYPGVNKAIEPKRDPQGNLLNQDDAHPNWGIQNTTNDTIGTVRAVEEYTDLAYDLGASGNITGFVIGSTAEPKSLKKTDADAMTQQQILDWYKANLQKHLRLRKGAFYVSDDKSTLFTGTPVATWDLTADETPIGAKYVLDAAVQGQYVGFRLYDFDSESWSNQVRIGELAVHGSVLTSSPVVGATLSKLIAAPTDTSLIAGKTPLTEQLTASVPLESNYRNGKAAAMTDGVYPGVNKDIEPKRDPQGNLLNQDDAHPNWGIQNTTNDTIGTVRAVEEYTDLAYDLGASGSITGFVIGSTAEPKSLKKTDADAMTQQQILDWYKANLQKHLRLRKGAFYVSDDKSTLFTGTPVATWDLTADETPIGAKYVLDAAVQGQYVGFRLYDFDSESWSNQVRIGELAVHGSVESGDSLTVIPVPDNNAYVTQVAGKTNLLLGEAVANKPQNYLSPAQATNTGEVAWLTDGKINWNTSDPEEKVQFKGDGSVVDITYDLRGVAKLDGLFAASSSTEKTESRNKEYTLYAADEAADLYKEQSFVGHVTLTAQQLASTGIYIPLDTLDVKARYIGIRLTAASGSPLYNRARFTELGLYGSYVDADAVLGYPVELLLQSESTLVDYFEVSARGLHNKTAVDVDGNPGSENSGTLTTEERASLRKYEDMEAMTDGNPDTRNSIGFSIRSESGNGNIAHYNDPWVVMVYHLGGKSRLDTITLTSSNEPEYYISGVQYYASDKYDDLFKNESLLYTTGGEHFVGSDKTGYLPDINYEVKQRAHSYTLTTEQQAKTYRYVAFVITRPFPLYKYNGDYVYGYAQTRVGELSVAGVMVEPEQKIANSFKADSPLGEATVTIEAKNFDDRAFFDNISHVTITEEALPAGVRTNVEDNWLTTTGNTMLHVRIYDKQGNPITDNVDNRCVEVTFPAKAEETRMMGILRDGQIQRLYNSNTKLSADGAFIRAGDLSYPVYPDTSPNNRRFAVIDQLDFCLVMLKYNDVATIDRLNGVDTKTMAMDYFAQSVAGAEATKAANTAATVTIVAGLLAAVTVSGVYLLRRKRRSEQ